LRRFTDVRARAGAIGPAAHAKVASGELDGARVVALRDGLAPGVFSRLLEQCLADMDERLPLLAAAAELGGENLRETAHGLAGMAGSYGLVGFERQMRAIMRAADVGDGADVARLAAEAVPCFIEGKAALLAFLRAA
jgi:hypothetical protein